MSCDVLIVGAGPAGSSLARQLAQAGFDVRLIDKKRFPRPKPCGEFLSPECAPYLRQLGLGTLLAQLGAHSVTGMRLHHRDQHALGRFRALDNGREQGRLGFAVRRERFDDALLQATAGAGAHVVHECDFVNLHRDPHGAVCGATLRHRSGETERCAARWVIGADGVHSRVANALGLQRRIGWLDQMALVAHFEGVASLPTAEVHLLRGGFFAATTVDQDLFSVNLVLPRHALRTRTTSSWDDFVAAHVALAPQLAPRLAGARRLAPWRGAGPFAFRTTQVWQPGAALVGDAAGYIDPLTGEGIYFALFGARALGDALSTALHEPHRGAAAMRDYSERRHREIAPRLFAARLLQRGLRHPWLVGVLLRALRRWPTLADVLVTMSGDTVHPRDLWRPSFWRDLRSSA